MASFSALFLRPPPSFSLSLSDFLSFAGEDGMKRSPKPKTLITGSTRTLAEYDLSMPLGRGRRGPMPADAGVLEHRSRPRNTTRPDALTRGLSAATAGRAGRQGPRGRHGAARGFLPESEEDAEDEDEARVRSGCAGHGGSGRLGCSDASAAAPILSAADLVLDMRWRRFATGAERVRSGEHDGGGGRRACFPESTEEADEDDEESRERSGRKCASRRCRHPSAAHFLSSLAFLELDTRWRRSRHRRPAHRGARGDVGSDAGSTSRQGGGEHGADAGAGRCKGTSFPPEKSSSAVESAAAAAGTTRNSNSSPSSVSAAADGAAGQWNVKGSGEGEVTAAAAIAGGGGA